MCVLCEYCVTIVCEYHCVGTVFPLCEYHCVGTVLPLREYHCVGTVLPLHYNCVLDYWLIIVLSKIEINSLRPKISSHVHVMLIQVYM